ncbi:MAG: metallophosphoesterase [Candidatus Acetothermia bacterium]
MEEDRIEKIGVMSDSHERLDLLDKAVDLFNEEEVDLVLHAGDFISPLTAAPLSRLDVGLVGVFGNNDGDRLFLRRRFDEEDVGRIERGPHRMELGGKEVVLMHQPRLIEALEESTLPDLVIYGHTHEVKVSEGEPFVLNPGEVCGLVTDRRTVATVELDEMEVDIKNI